MKLGRVKRFAINFSLRYFKWMFLCFLLLTFCQISFGLFSLTPITPVTNRHDGTIHDIPAIAINSISTYDLKYLGANYIEPYPREKPVITAYRLIVHSMAIRVIYVINTALIVLAIFFWWDRGMWDLIRGRYVEATN